MYRLGWPCATFFAEIGVLLLIKVEIIHDNESNVYVATSPDLKGLVVEAETLDDLEKEKWDLVPELLTLDRPKLRAKKSNPLIVFSATRCGINGYEKLVKELLYKHLYRFGSHRQNITIEEKMLKNCILILIVFIPLTTLADIYKHVDSDGRVYYSPEPRKGFVRIIKSLTDEQIRRNRMVAKLQAEQAYREKVRATAKFLDDVEALRKSK